MAINSLKSRNWTDDQWYNFICGLIKEPSIVGPGPEPPTPTVNLGFGFAYIIPPNITRNGHRLTSANEIYFEIHVYTGQEEYARDCISHAYKLSLDTLELTACEPLNSAFRILPAYRTESFNIAREKKWVKTWVPSYARIVPQVGSRIEDKSYVEAGFGCEQYDEQLPKTYFINYANNTDIGGGQALVPAESATTGFSWFGSGRILFLGTGGQGAAYVPAVNGELDSIDGIACSYYMQKAMYNGDLMYVGDVTMGTGVNSKFVVWMYDLSEQKSYGYEFENPKLRYCMSAAGYVYLTGDYTSKMFVVDGIMTRAYLFDNISTDESIVLYVKESGTSLYRTYHTADDWELYTMCSYAATKRASSQDEISLLGLYDVAESDVSTLFNVMLVALPGMSPLTDPDHLMIVTQELDGPNTFLYSISTGELSEYGTNPNMPTAKPYRWGFQMSPLLSMDENNVYPINERLALYWDPRSGYSRSYLAYTKVGNYGITKYSTEPIDSSLGRFREAFVVNRSSTQSTVCLFGGNNRAFVSYNVAFSSTSATFSRTYTGTYTQTLIDRTTSDTYVVDSVTSCGDGYAVFWVGETGYIFFGVRYSGNATFTGTYFYRAFVLDGDSGSFDGARITMYKNGRFTCLYKRCDGGGSRIITPAPLPHNIVLS